jgi:hypothetical protein
MAIRLLGILCILIYMFQACGIKPKKYLQKDIYNYYTKYAPPDYQNPEIMKNVNDFIDLCHFLGVKGGENTDILRNVDFGDTQSKEVIGTCRIAHLNVAGIARQPYRQIIISTNILKDYGPYTFKAAIYHETAHCIFNVFNHSPNPNSMMNADIPNEDYLSKHFDEMSISLCMDIINRKY